MDVRSPAGRKREGKRAGWEGWEKRRGMGLPRKKVNVAGNGSLGRGNKRVKGNVK